MYIIIKSAIIFAALLNVPMLIHLNPNSESSPLSLGINQKIKYLSIFCGLLLIISFSLNLSFILIPYLLLLLYLSVFGLIRLLRVGIYRVEEFIISLAFMNLAVAFVWLAATMFESSFMGFDEPWISLTSIHFHYTACFSLCIFGLLGRVISDTKTKKLWTVTTLIIVVSIWGLALGITFSPALELFSALILSFCFIMNSILLTKQKHILFKVAGCLNIIAMLFSVGYALDNFGIINVSIDILTMLKSHGLINAFLFVPIAFLGFMITRPTHLMNPSSPPFSQLKTNCRVDRDIISKMGWESQDISRKCSGLLDSVSELESDHFDGDQTDKRINDFYLNTDKWEMKIVSEWGFGFSFLSVIWNFFSTKIGQMNFPFKEEELKTQIIPINSDLDGRSNVRAWVRNYKDSKKTIYAAFYATHESFGSRYMNIAFPFQLGNLTSILRFIGKGKKEIDVSTISNEERSGDEGIYFSSGGFYIRLPMNESIRVFVPENDNKNDLCANHRVWIFGIKLLDLKYSLYKAIP